MKNRIKELRKARGWSQPELIKQIDGYVAIATISKLERGKMQLSKLWMERLAKAFNINPAEFFDPTTVDFDFTASSSQSGYFSEDVTRKEIPQNHALSVHEKHKNRDIWQVQTRAIDIGGYMPGDLIVVDISAEATKDIKPGTPVIAQIYDPKSPTAKTVLRMFFPPHWLASNSSIDEFPPIDLRKHEVAIKGVIIARYSDING